MGDNRFWDRWRRAQQLDAGSRLCPGCNSRGFAPSVLGDDRCTFCDGTEGGNPPTPEEIAEAQRRRQVPNRV